MTRASPLAFARAALASLAPAGAVFALPVVIGMSQAAAGDLAAPATGATGPAAASSSASASASASASTKSGGDGGCASHASATAEARSGDKHSYQHDEQHSARDGDCSAQAGASARAGTADPAEDGRKTDE
jgi:hypothetical protein